MTSPLIEDHALLSDQRTTALVTREGDVDWLCLPRFDSDAVFCSLLGTEDHGHWSLRIADGEVVSRRYLPGTMVLETQWRSPTGTATVTEFMPIAGGDVSTPEADSSASTMPGSGRTAAQDESGEDRVRDSSSGDDDGEASGASGGSPG
ncbi:MAG TPA: trehalase-like domain-containing protein, partial [Brachybacterium sp.]|nr:trehalase-like domain-containing protein [Brachybacterium sp.]